jgi:hypothetical protein
VSVGLTYSTPQCSRLTKRLWQVVLSFNGRAFESESAAVAEPPQVRVTWNGIASLWAFGQGAARVARVMFEAQRAVNPDTHPRSCRSRVNC